MNSKSLMVIDPSLETPELESFNEIALHSPIKTTYHLPAIHSSKSMNEKFNNVNGIILMGSAASVHDSYKWIIDLERIIKKAIKKHIPVLGICFGHQFLAHLFGGKVDYLWKNSKKIGIRKVKVLINNLLIEPHEDFLVYSHREGVTKCPNEFNISAMSNMVNIEGMVHKNLPIWTFQPHIEASKPFAKRIGISSNEFEKSRSYSRLLLQSFLNKLK